MLYNSGYIVKNASDEAILSHRIRIGNCDSWPLSLLAKYRSYDEVIGSKSLYSKDGYFVFPQYAENGFGRAIDIIDDFDFVKEYMDVCRTEDIECSVMMIETEIPLRDVVRCHNTTVLLGWDCMATSYMSFLDEIEDTATELLSFTKRLNEFGLFDDCSDAKDFIKIRNRLVKNDNSLESAFEPILCRCSLVITE